MKALSIVVASAVGLALLAPFPAEAVKRSKNKKPVAAHSMKQHRRAAVIAPAPGVQSGSRLGPLYNGQDYLGDDPDPNIRAYLMKDMVRYYGAQ